MPNLGVDPGNEGAAVLSSGTDVLAVVAWFKRTRGGEKQYRIVCATDERKVVGFTARTAHGVGRCAFQYLRNVSGQPWRLCVEDFYMNKNVKTSVIMARWAGAMSGPLEDYAIGPAEWKLAQVWRKEVLRMSPWTGRAQAKRAAQTYIPAMFKSKPTLPQLARTLGVKLEHITDAAGIALSLNMETG